MPLLPTLQEAFEGLTKMADQPPGLSPAEARAWMHEKIDENFTALNVDRPPVASEVDHQIPVADGEVAARVYRPDADAPLPCYLYLHGGGWWLGTLDQSDSACRGIATDAECVVVSVDYGLAPEHKFPIATEDCYAALLWVADHADELGVDPSRIAVGGGSAGGNLAAVVALMARDRDGPDLVLQVLEVAVVDFTTPDKETYIDLYLGDRVNATSPYASPLLGARPQRFAARARDRARSTTRWPSRTRCTQRLRDAGIPVEERCWEGQFHGSMQLAKLIPDEAAAYHDQVVTALRRAFGTA